MKGYSQIDLDQVLEILREKALLTRKNLDILMPVAHKEIGEKINFESFKVIQIDVTDEIREVIIEDDEQIIENHGNTGI